MFVNCIESRDRIQDSKNNRGLLNPRLIFESWDYAAIESKVRELGNRLLLGSLTFGLCSVWRHGDSGRLCDLFHFCPKMVASIAKIYICFENQLPDRATCIKLRLPDKKVLLLDNINVKAYSKLLVALSGNQGSTFGWYWYCCPSQLVMWTPCKVTQLIKNDVIIRTQVSNLAIAEIFYILSVWKPSSISS